MRGFNSAVPYARELLKCNDIILLNEHWLHENRLCRLSEISGSINICAHSSRFASSENYGTSRGQGGVAIIWKDCLTGVSEIKDIICDRICGIRLQTKAGGVLNILSVYLPSVGSPEDYSVVIDELDEVISSREDGSLCIVGGDFNGDLGTLGGPRGYKKPSKQGRAFHTLAEKHNL